MRSSARVAWRVGAAVAFAATAALAVALSRGAPMHASLVSTGNGSAAHHAAQLRPCATSGLKIGVGDRDRTSRYAVEFTNVSGGSCTLRGYPSVSAYRAGGGRLGNAAVRGTSVAVRRVVLAPGGSAYAAVADAGDGPGSGRCEPVLAAGLRVMPPGQDAARLVPYQSWACAASGRQARAYLRVWPVQAAPGGTSAR